MLRPRSPRSRNLSRSAHIQAATGRGGPSPGNKYVEIREEKPDSPEKAKWPEGSSCWHHAGTNKSKDEKISAKQNMRFIADPNVVWLGIVGLQTSSIAKPYAGS
jgi:hypothetical protein